MTDMLIEITSYCRVTMVTAVSTLTSSIGKMSFVIAVEDLERCGLVHPIRRHDSILLFDFSLSDKQLYPVLSKVKART